MLGACLSSVSRFQCSSGSLCSNVAVCSLNSCDSGMRPYVGCRTDGLRRIDTSVPSSSSYLCPLTTTTSHLFSFSSRLGRLEDMEEIVHIVTSLKSSWNQGSIQVFPFLLCCFTCQFLTPKASNVKTKPRKSIKERMLASIPRITFCVCSIVIIVREIYIIFHYSLAYDRCQLVYVIFI